MRLAGYLRVHRTNESNQWLALPKKETRPVEQKTVIPWSFRRQAVMAF
uniref:Uncharacterized protein n=1 Tax=Rhizophora mucronata TaxID=61149 RepID=A0A2P2PUW2_RHIMU